MDFKTGESFSFNPGYKEFSILDYKNGYFLLSLKNDIGSDYISIVHKDGNVILEPVQYDTRFLFVPAYIGNSIVYYDGTDIIFIEISTGLVLKQIETRVQTETTTKK